MTRRSWGFDLYDPRGFEHTRSLHPVFCQRIHSLLYPLKVLSLSDRVRNCVTGPLPGESLLQSFERPDYLSFRPLALYFGVVHLPWVCVTPGDTRNRRGQLLSTFDRLVDALSEPNKTRSVELTDGPHSDILTFNLACINTPLSTEVESM